ncbi:MAG: hypothetical protein LBH18_04715 [Spirochaetaceae bacterium]|jgi:hypothetical protein|nr:hypothetical protein [Spirochaetaceae bacterium]
MPLSWNELRQRAASFVTEWSDKASAAREEADKYETAVLSVSDSHFENYDKLEVWERAS